MLLLQGPRSVGKSTLLRKLADQLGASVVDLDDVATRDAVAADPATFVARAYRAWPPAGDFRCRGTVEQASWLDGIAGIGHWRTRDGDEVDLVIERDDGAVVALEVKASQRVGQRELAPLRKLRDVVGSSFLVGIALHLGAQSYVADDRLHVIPVDSLWANRPASA